MTNFSVHLECAVTDAPADRVLHDFDRVADALSAAVDVRDQDLACDAEHGTLSFGMVVDAVDPDSALVIATAVARTALHAAGAGTPRWDDIYRVGTGSVAAAVAG